MWERIYSQTGNVMAIKSGRSGRASNGGRGRSTAKGESAKRPAAKKLVVKKVVPKAMALAAHGHAGHGPAPRAEHGTAYGHSRAPAVAPGKRPKLMVIPGKAKDLPFDRFGELSSAQREAAVKEGLPASFLDEAIAKVGVTRAALLAGVGISSSTAARVKQHRKRFSLEDSERLARLARLWHDAYIVYESDEGAQGWLTSPVPSAGGVPLSMLATQEGFERAERSIMQLAYGVFA
jgi:putative toxin-antitoxin system antitoxin component (TIGR02293 family)